jgi:uncharacterized radical SAM superfamily Fe-S cluster-containing enzyme
MEHGHLVDIYNKAQQLYEKKKFRRAKKYFEMITSEIYASDTDCVADMNLCNSSQEYLDDIEEHNLTRNIPYWILIVVIILISLSIYFLKK